MSRRTWYRRCGTTSSTAVFLSTDDESVPVERKGEFEGLHSPEKSPFEYLPVELRLYALSLT